MTRKSRCLSCGGKFKSQTEKKKHKKEYPDGSCAKSFLCSKEKKDAIEIIDKKLENMHKYAGSKGILLEIKKELMSQNNEDLKCDCPRCQIDKAKREIERRENMEEKQTEEIVEEESQEEESKEVVKEIVKIKMPKEQAKEEWKKYVDVLKKRKEKYLQTMKSAMYHMKEGRELIDVYKTIKQAGLNENNQPRLAIARADLKEVKFEKRDEGSGIFDCGSGGYGYKDDINLPQKTFSVHWERRDGEDDSSWNIKNKTIKTKVPIIPVEILPNGDLKNYYILWEASEWEELPETKDPLLLKRISENLFVILGAWDLTELEQSIISGGKY